MCDMIELPSCCVSHVDLQLSRIRRDEGDVDSVANILENQWTNSFNSNLSDIVSLSTSPEVPVHLVHYLLNTQEKGERAYQDFQGERLQTGMNKQFHDCIPRTKLKTFSSVSRKSGAPRLSTNIIYGRLVTNCLVTWYS